MTSAIPLETHLRAARVAARAVARQREKAIKRAWAASEAAFAQYVDPVLDKYPGEGSEPVTRRDFEEYGPLMTPALVPVAEWFFLERDAPLDEFPPAPPADAPEVLERVAASYDEPDESLTALLRAMARWIRVIQGKPQLEENTDEKLRTKTDPL